MDILNEKISDIEAEINRNRIFRKILEFSQNPENVNLGKVWKVYNEMWPKYAETLSTAKFNHNGRLTSAPVEIKKLLAKEFKERLRTRPMRSDLDYLKMKKKKLFQMKLKLATENSSKQSTMVDLEQALQDLKNNKSRDPEGFYQ